MSPPSQSDDDEDSIRTLRRKVDATFVERLTRVETMLHDLERDMSRHVLDLDRKVDSQKQVLDTLMHNNNQLLEQQKKSDPILNSLDSLVKVSNVMKWIIVTIMGGLGALATVLSIVDYFKKGP